jgi:hypothetical protein
MSLDLDLIVHVDTGYETEEIILWSRNITHNVSPMWTKAGMRYAMYESNGTTAEILIPFLDAGIRNMETDPVGFKQLNPENGWGSYEGALEFAKDFRDQCVKRPKATVRVCA